jgi:hypothetical protein
MGADCVTSQWQTSRLALFLRLANSPAGSLQQIALVALYGMRDPWINNVLNDLQLISPDLAVAIRNGSLGPFLVVGAYRSDAGEWLGAQPYSTFMDMTGHTLKAGPSHPRTKWHTRRIMDLFKICLSRSDRSRMYERITKQAERGVGSKLLLLHASLRLPGPPLDKALDWVGPQTNRSAVVALCCGDLALGRYAGNYFAKAFVPVRSEHCHDSINLGIEPSRVCIHCWHNHRQLVLDGEGHAFFECDSCESARNVFYDALSASLRSRIEAQGCAESKLITVLQSMTQLDWAAFGRFAARVRQVRRHMRRRFVERSERLLRYGYFQQKAQWKKSGGHVCRHGVFFKLPPASGCRCLTQSAENDWSAAIRMPALDDDLKSLVAVPFDVSRYVRLGVLQASMRRQGW